MFHEIGYLSTKSTNPKYLSRKSVWNPNILPSGWRLRLSTVGNKECSHSGNPTRVWNPPDWDVNLSGNKRRKPRLPEPGSGSVQCDHNADPTGGSTSGADSQRMTKMMCRSTASLCVWSLEGLRHTRKKRTAHRLGHLLPHDTLGLGGDWWRTLRSKESQASEVQIDTRGLKTQALGEYRPNCCYLGWHVPLSALKRRQQTIEFLFLSWQSPTWSPRCHVGNRKAVFGPAPFTVGQALEGPAFFVQRWLICRCLQAVELNTLA